jgi:hypothetical protein
MPCAQAHEMNGDTPSELALASERETCSQAKQAIRRQTPRYKRESTGMAHSVLESTLNTAATAARTSGNPMLFLNRLEAIHDNWHRRTFNARALGFLVFHWFVVEAFKSARCPSLWAGGIRAFTPANFANFGWRYNVTTRVRADDIDSFATFSLGVETWHNEAHMAVGQAFGIADDMMNPRVNIYYREFWRLHYFIDDRFVMELRRYDTRGNIRQKIDRLAQNQHANLYRI